MSRSNLQEPTLRADLPDSVDDYHYEDVVDAEGERTKAVKSSPLTDTPKPFDLTASHDPEDPDLAYTEALPNIWQRHQGGWSARIPDSNEGISDPMADQSVNGETELCFNIQLTLHWHLKRTQRSISGSQKQREMQIRNATGQGQVDSTGRRQRVVWR